jgi:DNA-binding CsgD family transcriptional regulator
VFLTDFRAVESVVPFNQEIPIPFRSVNTTIKRSEKSVGWLQGLLNDVGFGILILDADLEVYFCNETARCAFDEMGLKSLLEPKAFESKESIHFSSQRANQFYSHAKLATQGQKKFVLLGEGIRQIMVALSPISLSDDYRKPGVLVTTERKTVCKSGSLWAYGKALGLTASELRVLDYLANGQEPKIVAKSLEVSVTTVRSHIRSIIGKTESANLRDVLMKISKLPPMSDVSFA